MRQLIRFSLLALAMTACAGADEYEGSGPAPKVAVETKARCGGLDYLGTCEGDLAVWCERRRTRSRDCAAYGQTCGYIDDNIGYYCVDRSPAPPPEGPSPEAPTPEVPAPDPQPEEPAPGPQPEDPTPEPQPEDPAPDPQLEGPAPPPPGSDTPPCNIPPLECEGSARFCAELVPFEPVRGTGYWNYPLNGETDFDQYRSYARRDLMQLIKYATARTYCESLTWPRSTTDPALGLGDMSEADGSIPGSREGDPGHPRGTHVDGRDMDIAYYQTGVANSLLRSVCPHLSGGRSAYHCVGEPTSLDVRRSALFIGLLHHSRQLRVIGVDGRIGPLIEEALDALCEDDLLDGSACYGNGRSLAYETHDNGRGWYYFHHHHLHVSITGSRSARAVSSGRDECIVPGCPPMEGPPDLDHDINHLR